MTSSRIEKEIEVNLYDGILLVMKISINLDELQKCNMKWKKYHRLIYNSSYKKFLKTSKQTTYINW